MSKVRDATPAGFLLADPRLERLLTIGKEMNDLLAKMVTATRYLKGDDKADDYEAVEIARNQIARDFSKELAEAKALLPSLEDISVKLHEQQHDLEIIRKMNVGLAKIESLNGSQNQQQFTELATSTKMKISEIDNLIQALDALHADLSTARRAPHICPRCSSTRVSYRITPSDLGFTLYRCDECGNAWRITRFSLSTT